MTCQFQFVIHCSWSDELNNFHVPMYLLLNFIYSLICVFTYLKGNMAEISSQLTCYNTYLPLSLTLKLLQIISSYHIIINSQSLPSLLTQITYFIQQVVISLLNFIFRLTCHPHESGRFLFWTETHASHVKRDII